MNHLDNSRTTKAGGVSSLMAGKPPASVQVLKWLSLITLLSCGTAWAQTGIGIEVGTVPVGAAFSVDGVSYLSTQFFTWPSGSKHIVQFTFTQGPAGTTLPYQLSSDGLTQFVFGGWTSGGTSLGGGQASVTVTASASTPSVIAQLSENYQSTILFPNSAANATCAGAPGNPAANGFVDGVVYFNGSCIASTTTTFVPAGTVSLIQFPFPGWVFYGWAINNTFVPGTVGSATITGPSTFTPMFSIAKRVHFMTSPPGLQVLVDRSPSQTPLTPSANGATCNPVYNLLPPAPPLGFPALCFGDFDFLPGSPHTIGANTPQIDQVGNYWVFEGFTNGTGQSGTYIPDNATNVATTVTASFVAGVKVTLTTSQPGLQLSVDGRTNWQGYNFVWGQGEKHTISAPATQTDAQGRTWTFTGWSNGGAATQTLTMPTTTTNLALMATFSQQPQLTINSVPQGLQFTVDGSPCGTPCVVNRPSGTSIQVIAPATIASSPVSRIAFTSWSDGSTANTRSITFSQNTVTLSATYQSQWALVTTTNPAGSAAFTFNPASSDGFFNDGTQVTVSVAAANGYKFVKWSGDFSGTFSTGFLTMSSPHAITANMQAVPFIAPAGIMSAAGATPDGTMAPGSVISIYGNSLAPALQIASTNPLPQSLGNVTVTIGNYILPLLFVSPGQINAQLPSELVDGTYTLLVQQTGQSDVSGQLAVSRDAPGVFTQANAQQLPLVLALHEDGTTVTFDSPAIHGETISLFGTGFGPYTTTVVDGFFVPAAPSVNVSDSVMLNIGQIVKAPDFAGAAPGMVGMTLVKMKITDDMPTGTTINLSVMVNTKLSTTVVLPLQ
jgi:uncharacterized protein (TIGR03437 family)